MGPIRVAVDNIERWIRVLRASGEWVDLEPFRTTAQTFELEDLFLAVQERDRIPREALFAYDYDGRCLWSLGAEELPLRDGKGPMYVSQMHGPQGKELRLNRGNSYCVIKDAGRPEFGEAREHGSR